MESIFRSKHTRYLKSRLFPLVFQIFFSVYIFKSKRTKEEEVDDEKKKNNNNNNPYQPFPFNWMGFAFHFILSTTKLCNWTQIIDNIRNLLRLSAFRSALMGARMMVQLGSCASLSISTLTRESQIKKKMKKRSSNGE